MNNKQNGEYIMIIEAMAITTAIAAFIGAYKGLNKPNLDNVQVMRGLPVVKPDYQAIAKQNDREWSKGADYSTTHKAMLYGK